MQMSPEVQARNMRQPHSVMPFQQQLHRPNQFGAGSLSPEQVAARSWQDRTMSSAARQAPPPRPMTPPPPRQSPTPQPAAARPPRVMPARERQQATQGLQARKSAALQPDQRQSAYQRAMYNTFNQGAR